MDEGKIEKLIRNALPSALPDHPIFVPCMQVHKHGRPFNFKLMEGYVFVESSLPEIEFLRLERSPYVQSVMSSPSLEGIRVCLRIPNSNIDELRHKLKRMANTVFHVGMGVKITTGTYSKLEGEIVAIHDNHCEILIDLRSLMTIVKISNSALEIVDEKTERAIKLDAGIMPNYPQRVAPLSVYDMVEMLGEECEDDE
jgi:transcription antitermination factor NusG